MLYIWCCSLAVPPRLQSQWMCYSGAQGCHGEDLIELGFTSLVIPLNNVDLRKLIYIVSVVSHQLVSITAIFYPLMVADISVRDLHLAIWDCQWWKCSYSSELVHCNGAMNLFYMHY